MTTRTATEPVDITRARELLADLKTTDYFEDDRDAYRLLGRAEIILADLIATLDGGGRP